MKSTPKIRWIVFLKIISCHLAVIVVIDDARCSMRLPVFTLMNFVVDISHQLEKSDDKFRTTSIRKLIKKTRNSAAKMSAGSTGTNLFIWHSGSYWMNLVINKWIKFIYLIAQVEFHTKFGLLTVIFGTKPGLLFNIVATI